MNGSQKIADRIAASANTNANPECALCGTTEGLRIKCDGGGYTTPEYVCEDCFTGTDDGPSFDDLPEA